MCEQLAQSRYRMVERLGIEPATFQSLVKCRNYDTSTPLVVVYYVLLCKSHDDLIISPTLAHCRSL